MIILPAIDMISGKPVRLYQGDYSKKETVAESVLDTAKTFEEAGSKWLHMVDLDGAKTGKKENSELIVLTAASTSLLIEVGGGIRSYEDVSYYLEHGIQRVILGTAAIEDEELLKKCVYDFKDKIAVGMDCKDGFVCGRGWLSKSGLYYLDFAEHLEEMGVKTVIFTDISKDGTLEGPNVEMLQRLQERTDMQIIASGGIKDLESIEALKSLNLYGAITGKAVYAGTLDLKEAIRIGEGR